MISISFSPPFSLPPSPALPFSSSLLSSSLSLILCRPPFSYPSLHSSSLPLLLHPHSIFLILASGACWLHDVQQHVYEKNKNKDWYQILQLELSKANSGHPLPAAVTWPAWGCRDLAPSRLHSCACPQVPALVASIQSAAPILQPLTPPFALWAPQHETLSRKALKCLFA